MRSESHFLDPISFFDVFFDYCLQCHMHFGKSGYCPGQYYCNSEGRDSCPKSSLKMYTVMSSCVCQKSTSGTNYYDERVSECSRAFTTASCRYPQQLSSSRSFPRRGNFLLFRIMAAVHTVRNLHFLSKNSTLISRENWVKNS